MRKLIRTEIAIQAPAEVVWRHLTDFESFPEWNPFIRRASGRPQVGERLDIRLQLGPGPLVRFTPRVVAAVPGRTLRWLARTGPPRLFDVVRSFELAPRPGEGVVFTQSEVCTGLLTPLMFAVPLERWLYAGYDAFNEALRERAEADVTTPPSEAAAPGVPDVPLATDGVHAL